MNNVIQKILKGDRTIWAIFIALCIISLLAVFSATSTIGYRHQNYWSPIIRHATFLGLGIGLVIFLQAVKTKVFNLLVLVLPVTWIMLIITFLVGDSVNGAQRFIGIGAYTIQPSELAKIALVGFMAFLLSRQKTDNEKMVYKILLWGVGITFFLIVPENLSTGILLLLVCFLMMIIGQVSSRRLLILTGVGFLSGLLFIGTLKLLPEETFDNKVLDRFSTWKARIDRFFAPEIVSPDGEYEITKENYQETHAKIAIANGFVPGLPGSSVERDYLPQAYSDFIFAIILEELGLPGGILVILLYVALLIRSGILASRCEKTFPRYLILGCALMIAIQAAFNMCVAVGIAPVTGQPLPLISRGGTSTLITCAYIGIILACSLAATEEEHEEVDESLANIGF